MTVATSPLESPSETLEPTDSEHRDPSLVRDDSVREVVLDPFVQLELSFAELPPHEEDPLEGSSAGDTTMTDDDPIGALSHLLLVEMQQDDIQRVVRAMCAFAGSLLSRENKEHAAQHAIVLGGHAVVFLVMKRWESSEQLQRVGCSCLLLLTRHMRSTIVAAGGVDVVMRAMELFPDSVSVQRGGCAVLASCYLRFPLAPASISRRLDRLVTRKRRGVVQLVVATMKKHPLQSDLQDICCRFLGNLSRNKQFCIVLRQARAMSAVTAAMERNPDHEAILLCAKKVTAAVLE